jgi:hypothetical protein
MPFPIPPDCPIPSLIILMEYAEESYSLELSRYAQPLYIFRLYAMIDAQIRLDCKAYR